MGCDRNRITGHFDVSCNGWIVRLYSRKVAFGIEGGDTWGTTSFDRSGFCSINESMGSRDGDVFTPHDDNRMLHELVVW